MSIVRIVIAEDFAAFRRAICSILEKGEDLEVVCEVGDGRDAVQKSEELKPELILLDIGLPTLNGLSLSARNLPLTWCKKPSP